MGGNGFLNIKHSSMNPATIREGCDCGLQEPEGFVLVSFRLPELGRNQVRCLCCDERPDLSEQLQRRGFILAHCFK